MGTDTHQRRTLATGDLVFVTRPETSGAFGDRVVTTVWPNRYGGQIPAGQYPLNRNSPFATVG